MFCNFSLQSLAVKFQLCLKFDELFFLNNLFKIYNKNALRFRFKFSIDPD